LDILIRLLGTLAPILYGLASASYAMLFLRGDALARKASTRLLVASLGVHAAHILLSGVSKGMLPLGNVFESASAIAFAIAAVYLYVETRTRNPMTGIFVIPVVFALQTISSALSDRAAPAPDILRSAMFGLHASAAILGYCAFAVAAIYGLLFLVLYHELKSRRFSLVYDRLPPLEVLAQMNIRSLSIGFVFLSAAIVFGAVWIANVREATFRDPKVFLTLVAWALFGFGILAHFLLGWRGPRVIYDSVAGFLLLVSSSVALNIVGSTFHVFH
jgi:ABC-type uncharacterized transport system permease subunit